MSRLPDPKKLALIRYPDPRLRTRCAPVTEFTDALHGIAKRMVEIMRQSKGVGLAAPQVGLNIRLFVCQAPDEKEATICVNPRLDLGDETMVADEGCLSIPDVTVAMTRSRTAMLTAFDARGREFRADGADILARIWQHENDHLDGKLIIDRMTAAEKIANRRFLRDLEKEFEPSRRGAPRTSR